MVDIFIPKIKPESYIAVKKQDGKSFPIPLPDEQLEVFKKSFPDVGIETCPDCLITLFDVKHKEPKDCIKFLQRFKDQKIELNIMQSIVVLNYFRDRFDDIKLAHPDDDVNPVWCMVYTDYLNSQEAGLIICQTDISAINPQWKYFTLLSDFQTIAVAEKYLRENDVQ